MLQYMYVCIVHIKLHCIFKFLYAAKNFPTHLIMGLPYTAKK